MKTQNFSSENFHFLVVEFSIYLNRRVFVMESSLGKHFYYLTLKCLNKKCFKQDGK